jgi:hypothetical protein
VTAIFLPETPTGRNPAHYPYGDLKQPYNRTKPADDLANYGEAFRYRLQQVQADSARVDSLLHFFLPDLVRFEPSQPQAYPNGRSLSEDAVYWTIRHLNPFMAATDSTLQLPESNPQPLTATFPYAAPPLRKAMASAERTPACPWWNLPCHIGRALSS